MIPSKIFLPSTYPNCSFDMREDRSGLSLLAMVFVMILKIKLHKAICQILLAESTPFSLGIRERNVELKAFKMFPIFLESLTMAKTSSLMVCQQVWKKLVVKPSKPRDFPWAI